MRKRTPGRTQPARELRDACMLLAARHGVQRELSGTPILEVTLGPFTIRLTPWGARRELEVWHHGLGGAPVLDLGWSGPKLEILSFRRGAWEQELLTLAR